MAGGINMDEEKRRLQYMQMKAEQQVGETQKLDFEGRKQPLNLKKLLSTVGILLAVLLVLIILNQSGIL